MKLVFHKQLAVGLAALLLVLVVGLLVVGLWRPGTWRAPANAGHQLGGDLFPQLPGNTVKTFTRAISEYESSDDYLYSECDIRETCDGRLVVFHDWDLSNVPDTPENRLAVEGERVGPQPINRLSLAQLKSLRLKGGHVIPTLQEVLDAAASLKIKKPLILEIKVLQTDEARFRLIEDVERYRDRTGAEIHFSSFVRNISRSFPEPRKWLNRFSLAGFCVYQVYRPKTKEYDLCKTW